MDNNAETLKLSNKTLFRFCDRKRNDKKKTQNQVAVKREFELFVCK